MSVARDREGLGGPAPLLGASCGWTGSPLFRERARLKQSLEGGLEGYGPISVRNVRFLRTSGRANRSSIGRLVDSSIDHCSFSGARFGGFGDRPGKGTEIDEMTATV